MTLSHLIEHACSPQSSSRPEVLPPGSSCWGFFGTLLPTCCEVLSPQRRLTVGSHSHAHLELASTLLHANHKNQYTPRQPRGIEPRVASMTRNDERLRAEMDRRAKPPACPIRTRTVTACASAAELPRGITPANRLINLFPVTRKLPSWLNEAAGRNTLHYYRPAVMFRALYNTCPKVLQVSFADREHCELRRA